MRLTIGVIIAHFLLVIFFFYFHSPSSQSPSPSRAHVRTLVLEERSKKSSKLQPPSPKKESKKTKVSKSQPKATSSNRKQLLALMQESLNTLESNQIETSPPPLPIGKLSSEQLHFETSYEEELVDYLQQLLEFPHRGIVSLLLTLSRDGKVQEVTILSATNEENHRYITSTLPTLSLPPFGNKFKGEKNHTFSLTLTSTL